MADTNKTLVTRADLTSLSTPGTGRHRITLDGGSTEAASYTGIRDITGMLMPGRVTSGRLLIARKDTSVLWFLVGITLPPESEGQNWAILLENQLQAFRPFYESTQDYKINSAGHIVRLAVTAGARFAVQFAKAGIAINTVVETFTQAGWPTTLPGVEDGQPVVV